MTLLSIEVRLLFTMILALISISTFQGINSGARIAALDLFQALLVMAIVLDVVAIIWTWMA